MTTEEFISSISPGQMPSSLSPYLRALWYDGIGDWEKAHHIIQDMDDKNAAWVHAYLHRREGDIGNADYWYRRAGKKRPAVTLRQEWEEMVKELISY